MEYTGEGQNGRMIDFDGSYSCVEYLNLFKGPVFAPVFHNTVLMCKFNDFWCL